MRPHLLGRDRAFEHRLDEIDPPARAVALVAQQKIGGARRRTQAAMDASPQDRLRLLDARVLELLRRKVRFHAYLKSVCEALAMARNR